MGRLAGFKNAILLGLLASQTVGVPQPSKVRRQTRCANPVQRREWRTLSDMEKWTYLNAEICLMNTPSNLNLPGAFSKFDELVSNHQIQGRLTHATGVFLPYHRYLLHAHETLLKRCGYTGPTPWWNETTDVGNYSVSPLLATYLGFGGDGEGPDRCILSGPFAGLMTTLGPGFQLTTRCVSRQFNHTVSYDARQEYVDACDAFDRYEDVFMCFYGEPHHAGHGGIGGVMIDALTSPADPIFYMHHAFIDKIWADWQDRSPHRVYDIGGINVQNPEVGFPEFEGTAEDEGSQFLGFPTLEMLARMPSGTEGDGGDVTTLNHVLSSLGIIPDVAVWQVMDTRGEYLCYEYV